MTLERPAYTVEVGSYTAGWEFSATHGLLQPDLETHPVQIADGLTLTWGYDPNAYIGQLVPAQASFSLICPSDQVPEVAPGDLVYVRLYRLGSDGEFPIPYMLFEGVLDDPVAVPSAYNPLNRRGVRLNLIATDLVTLIAEALVDDSETWPEEGITVHRLPRIAYGAGFNLVTWLGYNMATALGPISVANRSALTLVNEVLASLYLGSQQLVLRARHRAAALFPEAGGLEIIGDPDSPVTFLLDRLGTFSLAQTPYQLVLVPVGIGFTNRVTRERRTGPISELAGGLVLDACDVLLDPVVYRKSRAAAINQVKLIGLNDAGEDISVTASYPDLVKERGANTREVRSQALLSSPTLNTEQVVGSYLPDRGSASPTWAPDTFVLTTKNMTDDELDAYTPKLFPHIQAAILADSAPIQIPVAILDVAQRYYPLTPAQADLGGDRVEITGTLIGGTFQILDGELTFTGTVRNESLRPEPGVVGGSVSYQDLKDSDDFDVTQFHDVVPDDQHIDPNLSYADFRLIGI